MTKDLTLQETGAQLMQAQNLVLCTHVSPDGDCLGSALGLARALRKLGKDVTILCDDVYPKFLTWLSGAESVVRPQAGERYTCDLLVVLDASSLDRIGMVDECVERQATLNIDHHISNEGFTDYRYLDAQAAATGEIMCDLFQAMAWEMDAEMANCFYTAIGMDCGFFRYSNTTPKTMRNAAYLLENGAEPSVINDALAVTERKTVELLAKVLPSLSFAGDDKIAYMTITNDLYDKSVNTDLYVNYPRGIEGVDVGILFKAVEPEVTRVSMRSKTVDVAEVALKFGGGGHVRAAGCTIYAEVEEARKQLLAELVKLL